MNEKQKLILIGGASHTGKSTLARSLASHLNRNYYSTDKLARHPGRPWQPKLTDIPKRVIDHYQLLSADELIEDVLNHYRLNVWRSIEDIVTSHANDLSSDNVIIEGSALLPELVNMLKFDNIYSIWLTASNDLLRKRIYISSQYATKSPFEQMLVDKFWERNCLLNDRIIGTAVDRRSAFSPRRDGNGERLGLVSLDVEATSTDELIRMFLSTLEINGDLK